MDFIKTEIAGVYLVAPTVIRDERGEFYRTYDERLFSGAGQRMTFVQHNHSLNYKKGTWRGFHYQLPPMTETKLIRCTGGKVLDVVLDLRKNSETFLQWKGFELSPENKLEILIPGGCAHGFMALEDNTTLLYCHTQFYDQKSEAGIRHDDPRVKLVLPMEVSVISARDQAYPLLPENFKGIEL